MIELPEIFKNDTQGNTTHLVPLIIINDRLYLSTQKAKLRNYLNARLRNKKKMSTGGVLKQPDNPGLKKLPTAVRNKMGFMKKGGNVGHTDYRKASKGMLLISVDMMKKKKKNK